MKSEGLGSDSSSGTTDYDWADLFTFLRLTFFYGVIETK